MMDSKKRQDDGYDKGTHESFERALGILLTSAILMPSHLVGAVSCISQKCAFSRVLNLITSEVKVEARS
jgi:hypothetical protein